MKLLFTGLLMAASGALCAQNSTGMPSGNIGIGTTTPDFKLTVTHSDALGTPTAVFNNFSTTHDGMNIGGFNTNNSHWKIGMIYAQGHYNPMTKPRDRAFVFTDGNINTGSLFIGPWSDYRYGIYLNGSNGRVGIGTSSPQSTLSVNGEIYSKKVKVTQSGWPDYVFLKGYKLLSLAQVERFIKQNGHLPDVLPAAEIEKSGLDLGDNQATLLKKIEELTLYLIELDKKVKEQQAEIERLKQSSTSGQ